MKWLRLRTSSAIDDTWSPPNNSADESLNRPVRIHQVVFHQVLFHPYQGTPNWLVPAGPRFAPRGIASRLLASVAIAPRVAKLAGTIGLTGTVWIVPMQLFCLDRDLLEAKRVFRASQAMDVDQLGIKAVGGRAARLHDVLAAIKSGFHDPAFSSQNVAQRLGLSRRYVNDLLAESGSGFAERVLEMRLHEARVMLTDAAHDRLKVNEIAWTCGFNEVPYFNRRFRRRFGTTPTELREASRRTK